MFKDMSLFSYQGSLLSLFRSDLTILPCFVLFVKHFFDFFIFLFQCLSPSLATFDILSSTFAFVKHFLKLFYFLFPRSFQKKSGEGGI